LKIKKIFNSSQNTPLVVQILFVSAPLFFTMKIQLDERKMINRSNNGFAVDNLAPSQQIIQESSDISEVIKELNNDKLDSDSFSSIDTKTRLTTIDISKIVTIDGLVALRFLPKEVSVITRSKKRLAVSLNGEGRKEIVQVANGLIEETQNRGFGDKLKGLFSNKA